MRDPQPLFVLSGQRAADADARKAALGYLADAWAEAERDGLDGDCLAQAALFLALKEFVSTYGEEPAATFVRRLDERIRAGEFTVVHACQ